MAKTKNQDKNKEYSPVVCPNCGRFLFEEAVFLGRVRIKCKCKAFVIFEQLPEFKKSESRLRVKREEGKIRRSRK